MSKLLSEWEPSEPAIDLIKLNGISEEQMIAAREYLKNQSNLKNIDDVDGYDNWDALFIMFCLKANPRKTE